MLKSFSWYFIDPSAIPNSFILYNSSSALGCWIVVHFYIISTYTSCFFNTSAVRSIKIDSLISTVWFIKNDTTFFMQFNRSQQPSKPLQTALYLALEICNYGFLVMYADLYNISTSHLLYINLLYKTPTC